MESYQAIYDAAMQRLDISWLGAQAQNAISAVEMEYTRPSVMFKPKLTIDGNSYCALYGEDIMSGCAGFGATADAAMRDFDRNWQSSTAPKPRQAT